MQYAIENEEVPALHNMQGWQQLVSALWQQVLDPEAHSTVTTQCSLVVELSTEAPADAHHQDGPLFSPNSSAVHLRLTPYL